MAVAVDMRACCSRLGIDFEVFPSLFLSFSLSIGNRPSTSEAEPARAAKAVNVIVSSYPHAGIEAGQYIAFETPDGSLVVSIFGWYSAASAAEALAVTVGDRVILESI